MSGETIIEAMARAACFAEGGCRCDSAETCGHDWTSRRGVVRAALAAALERGWVLVPKEPTEQMWRGWRSVNCELDGEFTRFHGDWGEWLTCYHAMLEACPAIQSGSKVGI